MNNPFFIEWMTPYGTPPFNLIKAEHYMPAFEEGLKRHDEEIKTITQNVNKPTFKNTIEALELSGSLLETVELVFTNVNAACTNKAMQAISKKIAPVLARHDDEINMNAELFERIKILYTQRNKLKLSDEQKTVLKNYYQDFIRGGIKLNENGKNRLKEINQELALLGVQYGENIINESNDYICVITNKEELAGLPVDVIKAAAQLAKKKVPKNKWCFNLQKASLLPVLKFAENRELREKLYKAYINRGNNGDKYDNKTIASKMAALRSEAAKLLGYKNYAYYILEERMVKKPDEVYKLLNRLIASAITRAKKERDEIKAFIKKDGGKFKPAPWDWFYYTEKIRKEKYELNEEEIKQYFTLENVRDGAFEVVKKLYGISFCERNDIPVYHPDVKAFEVKNKNGKHLGIFYVDYFAREGKETGAWCNAFRVQSNINGKSVTPVEYNVCNFPPPQKNKPVLLNLDEVKTLFHEFGHAVHGLVSKIKYPDGAGRIPVDFVELPSQVMENWACEREVLKLYAKHYKNGNVIPDNLIDKIESSSLFNQGFENTELIAAAILDMDWHVITDTKPKNLKQFERASINRMKLIPEIAIRYQSTNFLHIFAGDEYAAGYYGYIWSQILDADVFEAFKKSENLFNKKLADSFLKNILEKQGSEEPMNMYKKFLGRKPDIKAYLKKNGL